jgi:hypothetical protein
MQFQHSGDIWRDFPALVPGVLYADGIASQADVEARADRFAGVAPVAAAATGVLLGGPAPRPLVWAGIAVVAVGLALGFAGGKD